MSTRPSRPRERPAGLTAGAALRDTLEATILAAAGNRLPLTDSRGVPLRRSQRPPACRSRT